MKLSTPETRYPSTRADLARYVPPCGLIVELGVAKGDFAEAMRKVSREFRYVGVDSYAGDRGHDDTQYRAARDRIYCLGGQLIRGSFADEVKRVPDRYIDLVYVDGYAHTGQEGGLTLTEWWPKVKPGGIFAGHDYSPRWQPTIDAVNAFTRAYGLEKDLRIIFEEKGYDSWWIRKPFDSASVA